MCEVSCAAVLVVCELDRTLDKAAMRKALEKALREVEVPALPPLLVCGVGFNQQAWTQRVVAEKDAAEKDGAEKDAAETAPDDATWIFRFGVSLLSYSHPPFFTCQHSLVL